MVHSMRRETSQLSFKWGSRYHQTCKFQQNLIRTREKNEFRIVFRVIESVQLQNAALRYPRLTANQAPFYTLCGGSAGSPNLAEVNIVLVNRTLAIPIAAIRAVVGVSLAICATGKWLVLRC